MAAHTDWRRSCRSLGLERCFQPSGILGKLPCPVGYSANLGVVSRKDRSGKKRWSNNQVRCSRFNSDQRPEVTSGIKNLILGYRTRLEADFCFKETMQTSNPVRYGPV